MVRSSARVDGFYRAVSIGWAMQRQPKVPVLSEAVLLMKNAHVHLPGELPVSLWRSAGVKLRSRPLNHQRAL
jgi:hypothetical protein